MEIVMMIVVTPISFSCT